MKTYNINGKQIELDESKEHLDFYLVEGEGKLPTILFDKLLEAVEAKKVAIDNQLKEYLTHLTRWTTEAPRKRHFRKMRKDGMIVVSGEQFFDADGGEEIIDNLERTGVLSTMLLKEFYP